MIGLELIAACVDTVPAGTVAQIIRVESAGRMYALNINGKRHRQPANKKEALEMARSAIAAGYSVDVGLMQINSQNFTHVGYSLEELFEPCNNMRAGAKILSENYRRARQKYDNPHRALAAALSVYNTGSQIKGFRNGYVQKFYDIDTQDMPQMYGLAYRSDTSVYRVQED